MRYVWPPAAIAAVCVGALLAAVGLVFAALRAFAPDALPTALRSPRARVGAPNDASDGRQVSSSSVLGSVAGDGASGSGQRAPVRDMNPVGLPTR